MADTARARKLADRIQVSSRRRCERRIKDPRLGFVTITDTRVTGDLQEATVFYTVYGDDEEQAGHRRRPGERQGRAALARSAGRPACASRRRLEFVADALPDNAAHIDDLLARRRARATPRCAARPRDAQYAGDADPYRHSRATTDDEAPTTSRRRRRSTRRRRQVDA